MILSLYLANLKEFYRSKMALFWTLAFPVFFILLFGTIFSEENGVGFKVGVVNKSTGEPGDSITKALEAVEILNVSKGEEEAEMVQFKTGKRDFIIVIPEALTENIAEKKTTEIKVYYDPSSTTAVSVGLPIMREILSGIERQASGVFPLLTVKAEQLQKKTLRVIDYLLPGILAMSLMQLGLFATVSPLVQLREKGVLRRLGATPLPRSYLLISQLLFRLTIGLSQTAIIMIMGRLVFDVQMVGSWLLLISFVLLGALAFVSLGYLIAGLSSTVEASHGISQLFNLPMMFLSGIFFSVDMMPDFLKPIVKAMPLSYLGDALRQIMVGSIPLYSLELNALVLSGWLVICSLLAVKFFRWE